MPEPGAAEGIARQIKQSGRAYPLFGTGRLFLEKPERHRVRISSLDPTVVLYQIGDGPISLDQALLERSAFQNSKDEYYEEVVVQGEPIKGNFGNVARSRTTGALLGPTNYHSYQPNLRRLYEDRFAKRMSFQDFLYKDVEIRTDEQTINDWKEQARSTVTYKTKQADPVQEFKTLAEVEAHFRATYLRAIVKAGLSLECSGPASRQLPERALSNMVRDTWEKEKGFPGQLVNYLRPYLQQEQLHFFKHKKRMLFITSTKPVRHKAGEPMSPGVAAILQAVESTPKCTRRALAIKLLGENPDAPELAEQKASLARDLVYLLHSGHVIEFHDGLLELPLVPGANAQQQQQQAQGKGKKGGKPGAAATAVEAGAATAGEESAEADEPDVEAESVSLPEPEQSSEAPESTGEAATADDAGAAVLSEAGSTVEAFAAESSLAGDTGSEAGFATTEMVSSEHAAADLPAPIVVTQEGEVPSAAGFGEGISPSPDLSSNQDLPAPAGNWQETSSGESTGHTAHSFGASTEAVMPGAASLSEHAPAELVTPAEIVDLREQKPAADSSTQPESTTPQP